MRIEYKVEYDEKARRRLRLNADRVSAPIKNQNRRWLSGLPRKLREGKWAERDISLYGGIRHVTSGGLPSLGKRR